MCVSVCVFVGNINDVFVYKTQKGKMLCDLMGNVSRMFLTAFSPNFESKNIPSAQLDTACNTSASCCIAAADMTKADSMTA